MVPLLPPTSIVMAHAAQAMPDHFAREGPLLMSNTAPIRTVDTIQGTSLLAVQAALVPFREKGLDLAGYRVTVFAEGNSLFVAFTDVDAPLSGRGSPGSRPGFEVELDAKDLRVLRSSFMR